MCKGTLEYSSLSKSFSENRTFKSKTFPCSESCLYCKQSQISGYSNHVWMDRLERQLNARTNIVECTVTQTGKKSLTKVCLRVIGKKVEVSLQLFDIFERNMVFIFLLES